MEVKIKRFLYCRELFGSSRAFVGDWDFHLDDYSGLPKLIEVEKDSTVMKYF
jgi:hypothetical protein